MTPGEERELGEALPDKPTGRQPSISAQLVALALGSWRFVCGMDGETYAIPQTGPGLAQPLRGEGSVRKELAAKFFAASGQVANANALTDALVVLAARAETTDPRDIYQRVAPTPQGVLLDLGRTDLLMVAVTANGWETRPLVMDDPLFKRTRTMGQMPVPISGDSLEPLWELLNVRPIDRPVLEGWMVATLLPTIAQPFILFRGEQGTGKTTAARLLSTLLDPGPGQMTSTPRTEKDFGVAAQGRTVLALDNLSTITTSLSDTICRAVTGENIVSRRLYTDNELSILTYRIALILTAIDPGALRGDLAERMLPIQLEPLGSRRRSEQALLADFEAVRPEVLGAVLDRVADVLWHMSRAKEPEAGWPRMADFGMVLAAQDAAYDANALELYMQMTVDSEIDVIAGHPLADAIIRLIRDASFTGTPTELLEDLTSGKEFTRDERQGWRTAQELSKTLNSLTKSLRLVEVEVVTGLKSNGHRRIKISRTDAKK